MDTIKTIDELAQLMDKYGLDEISVDNGEFKAKMSKKPKMPPPPMMQQVPMMAPPQGQPVIQQINGDVNTVSAKPAGNVVKSPIIGTFYSAAAPGKPAFAAVGTKVTKGQTVCIVESMKLMNEIASEFDGTVAEIYVKDGDAVEFDQPLLRIE